MAYLLESTLEKIARIIATQFNISVVFEGNEAYTDGQKIVIPFFNEVTPELYADLNGYLDHEVAHCVFTDFPDFAKVLTHFHKELLNAVEDIRIERNMIKKYPGTADHILPLRDKLMGPKAQESLKSKPWPVRLLFSIQWIMEGRKFTPDSETSRHLDAVKEEIAKLNSCKSTRELRLVTEAICKKIKQDREEEKKESENNSKSNSNSGKPSGAKGEKNQDKGDSSKKTESQSGKDSETKEKGSKGDNEKTPEQKAADSRVSKSKEKDDAMLDERTGNPKSSFDQFELDVHRMVNKAIEKVIKNEAKSTYSYGPRSNQMSVPLTTRFDEENNHSGKGSPSDYSLLKRKMSPIVNPLKQTLERIFKAEENCRWLSEKEQGMLDARGLARWASNPAYRQVFKNKVKNQSESVAISLLVDLSGSMGGENKIRTALETTTAMSEALKGLDLVFEVLGFHSDHCREVSNLYNELYKSGGASRFSRSSSKIKLEIFKSFDSSQLSGLTEISAGGNNDDGESVFMAAKRLAQRKEKRKVLIVLSDGMPASCTDSNTLQNDLRTRLAMIEKAGIETVGIGIKTDAVKHFYKDYIVVNEVRDLTKVCMGKLVKILTQNIGRSKVRVAA